MIYRNQKERGLFRNACVSSVGLPSKRFWIRIWSTGYPTQLPTTTYLRNIVIRVLLPQNILNNHYQSSHFPTSLTINEACYWSYIHIWLRCIYWPITINPSYAFSHRPHPCTRDIHILASNHHKQHHIIVLISFSAIQAAQPS